MSHPIHRLEVSEIWPCLNSDLDVDQDIEVIHPPDCPDPLNERGECFVLEEMAMVGVQEALGFDPWWQEFRGQIPQYLAAGRYDVGLYVRTYGYPDYDSEWHLTLDWVGHLTGAPHDP